MPTTSYTDSTFSVSAIAARTDAAGGAVTDVSAEEFRLAAQILTEGYLTPTDAFEVLATSSPSMSVTVGSGTAKGDHYVVTGEVGGQGNYIVRLDVTSVTVTLNAADASQARTDEVYLVVLDNAYDASSRSLPRIAYRKGDLGGASPGADSAWEASVLLARIAVGAAVTTVTNANITDLRTAAGWAPGGDLEVALGAQVNIGGSASGASLAVLTPAFWAETLSTRQVGDSNNRFAIHADGFLDWGGGSGAVDTNLYRTAANTLRTDDHLQVGGNANVDSLDVVGDMSVGDDVTYAAGSVLTWAGDSNLYRSSANVLKSDDEIQAAHLASGGNLGWISGPVLTKVDSLRMRINASTDVWGNLDLRSGDSIFWNSDVNLYRGAANQLKTDDLFVAGGGVSIDGTVVGIGIGVPRVYSITSDVTVSTTTFASGISATIGAAGRYLVEGFLHYAAAPGTNMKMGWTSPTSSSGRWSSGGIQSSVGSRIGDLDMGMVDLATALTVSGDSGGPSVEIAARPVLHLTCTNTGTLVFQLAQGTGSAFPTTLRAGSSLRVTRLT